MIIFQAYALPVTLSSSHHVVFSYKRYIFWIFMVLSQLAHEDTPPMSSLIMSSFCHHVVLWYEAHLAHEDTPPPGLVLHLHLLNQLGSDLGVIMIIIKIIILSSWSLLVSSWSLFMWSWSAPSQGRPQASQWTSQLCTSWSDWRLGCLYSFIITVRWSRNWTGLS